VRWVRRALAQSGCDQNLVYLAHREGHALRHAHCDELFHLLKCREARRDSHACALGRLLCVENSGWVRQWLGEAVVG
jgi:hypothetical protein